MKYSGAQGKLIHGIQPEVKISYQTPFNYTVIRFVWVRAKFGTCTVVSVNGTLVEDKMRGFKSEWAYFSFNKRPIYTHDGASAKFSTNSQETDNSVATTQKLN
jgi:hypothetical protein